MAFDVRETEISIKKAWNKTTTDPQSNEFQIILPTAVQRKTSEIIFRRNDNDFCCPKKDAILFLVGMRLN